MSVQYLLFPLLKVAKLVTFHVPRMTPIDFQGTWSEVKVRVLVLILRVVYSISYDPLILIDFKIALPDSLKNFMNMAKTIDLTPLRIQINKTVVFTCVAKDESRSRSRVTPSVRPSGSQNLVIATLMKLLIRFS